MIPNEEKQRLLGFLKETTTRLGVPPDEVRLLFEVLLGKDEAERAIKAGEEKRGDSPAPTKGIRIAQEILDLQIKRDVLKDGLAAVEKKLEAAFESMHDEVCTDPSCSARTKTPAN